jgi:hypothetical protein
LKNTKSSDIDLSVLTIHNPQLYIAAHDFEILLLNRLHL